MNTAIPTLMIMGTVTIIITTVMIMGIATTMIMNRPIKPRQHQPNEYNKGSEINGPA